MNAEEEKNIWSTPDLKKCIEEKNIWCTPDHASGVDILPSPPCHIGSIVMNTIKKHYNLNTLMFDSSVFLFFNYSRM